MTHVALLAGVGGLTFIVRVCSSAEAHPTRPTTTRLACCATFWRKPACWHTMNIWYTILLQQTLHAKNVSTRLAASLRFRKPHLIVNTVMSSIMQGHSSWDLTKGVFGAHTYKPARHPYNSAPAPSISCLFATHLGCTLRQAHCPTVSSNPHCEHQASKGIYPLEQARWHASGAAGSENKTLPPSPSLCALASMARLLPYGPCMGSVAIRRCSRLKRTQARLDYHPEPPALNLGAATPIAAG